MFTIWLFGKSEEVDEEEKEENCANSSLRDLDAALQVCTREGMRLASAIQPTRHSPSERRYCPPVTGSFR